jgi:hypothetical protein
MGGAVSVNRIIQITDYAAEFGNEKTLLNFNLKESTLSGYKGRRQRIDNGESLKPAAIKQSKNLQQDIVRNALKEQYKDLCSKYKYAANRIAELEKQSGLTRVFEDHTFTRYTIESKYKGKLSEAVAFMALSDVHIEELVLPEKVNHLNEYNLHIAEERLKHFFEGGLKLANICRSGYKIDTLILALLGDIISGYIHEELIESNQLSPTKASLFAFDIIVSGIDYLLTEGKFSKIIVPCCDGNHGRTSQSYKFSTRTDNSFEWLLYSFLAKRYATDERVEIILTESYHLYLDVYGFPLRLHHGDAVRYSGGIGGISVPLNKAISEWNKAIKVYLDIIGHWHQYFDGNNVIVNGSVIGHNPFAIAIKAGFQLPRQTFFVLDKQIICKIS